MTEPRPFARDDDGPVIVAVATPHGVTHWRVTENEARSITFTDGPPAKSLQGCYHYRALDQR